MTRLEDLQPTAAVRGILPDQLVTVVSVVWFGSEALELTYKSPFGRVTNELLYRYDEPRLQVVEHGRPWSFDGDGQLFRLVSEAHRIRLAHLFDPVLAVHTSLVEPPATPDHGRLSTQKEKPRHRGKSPPAPSCLRREKLKRPQPFPQELRTVGRYDDEDAERKFPARPTRQPSAARSPP